MVKDARLARKNVNVHQFDISRPVENEAIGSHAW